MQVPGFDPRPDSSPFAVLGRMGGCASKQQPLDLASTQGDVEARLAVCERKMENVSELQLQTTALDHAKSMVGASRESAVHASACEEKLAAAEARGAAAEQLAERRFKASEATIASLQADLQAVFELATQAQQALLKPSRDQVLTLLRLDANLSGLDLSGLDLSGLDLSHVHFDKAYLVGTNFEASNLSGAVLSGANLEDAYLRDAVLRGANFRNAKFARAILTGADLRNSQLRGALGLGEARFDGTVDLRGATHAFKHPGSRPANGDIVVIQSFLCMWRQRSLATEFLFGTGWDPLWPTIVGIFSPADL